MRQRGQSPLAAPLGRAVRKAGSTYDRLFNPDRTTLVSLEPDGTVRGRVLLAHVVEGRLADPADPMLRRHNHYVEGRLLPEVFLELGYAVDYISWRNHSFVPRRRYDIFFAPREHFERIAERLDPDCLKIVHLDTTHWLFNNSEALARQRDLQARRGAALDSYKHINANRAVETADCATLLGNADTYASYRFAGKRVFQVPNPSNAAHPSPEAKNIEACRRNFLWLGSAGLVHKGLDVTLEAFARMPEMHLTVCGPIAEDRHFARLYHRELYETPNIRTHGWIDVTGEDFRALAGRTLGLVYPSCAEACCGSVVNGMHAGLIPIASRQCGIDIAPDFGTILDEISVGAVEDAVRAIAASPADRLADMMLRTWTVANRRHSGACYKETLSASIERIVAEHPSGADGFVPMPDVLRSLAPETG